MIELLLEWWRGTCESEDPMTDGGWRKKGEANELITSHFSSRRARNRAFSQTSSLALHGSLQNLRTRHTATLATLNAQIIELQRMHGEEQARGQALLRSLGTLGEEVGRESAGRRREIGL